MLHAVRRPVATSESVSIGVQSRGYEPNNNSPNGSPTYKLAVEFASVCVCNTLGSVER